MLQFTNQAQLSYNGTITNSNIAVGEILEVISGTKTAVVDEYFLNDKVTYVISIVNTSTTPYTNLTITDNLGSYVGPGVISLNPLTYTEGSIRYYTNGILQTAPLVATTTALVIPTITVPAQGNAIIIYEATANQFAPLEANSIITNEATITGLGIGTPIVVEAKITTTNSPILSITKSINPVPVSENGTLTYTFVIQNTGNTEAVALDNVIITDTFDPILEDITVLFNGTPWLLETNYKYDKITGIFQSISGSIIVPPATFTQDAVTGAWITNPGASTLIISGTV